MSYDDVMTMPASRVSEKPFECKYVAAAAARPARALLDDRRVFSRRTSSSEGGLPFCVHSTELISIRLSLREREREADGRKGRKRRSKRK